MFTKLLKHEWKATAGILGILSLAALGVGAVGAILMRYIVGSATDTAAAQSSEVLEGILTVMLIFSFLALFAYVIGSEIFLFIRFYRSRFTDEGYLTFTLPVRTWQIFLSSLLNIIIWTLIISAVMITSIFAIVFSGIQKSGVLDQFGQIWDTMNGINEFADIVPLQVLYAVVNYVSQIIVTMTCITVGAVLAKKHKLLASIGVYYGYSMVANILYTMFTVSTVMSDTVMDMQLIYLVQIIFQTIVGVGGFFLSAYLMEKKLNLP